MRILIVDDEVVSLMKLKTLLASYGECDTAASGPQAMEMFKKSHEEHKPYSLVTMDINMPGINGRDVVALIREWEENRQLPKTKIVMVTVMGDVKSVVSSMKTGCDAYLVKPFTPESVAEVIGKLSVKPKLGLRTRPPPVPGQA